MSDASDDGASSKDAATDSGADVEVPSTWTSVSSTTLSARIDHVAVWTGQEMLIWGGYDASYLGDGARYSPSTSSWLPIASAGAPAIRGGHSGVWTGQALLVWGGWGTPSG
ncbi:MAG: hypothetical protein ABI551_07805, partial [Polyangiaceae bacterium]